MSRHGKVYFTLCFILLCLASACSRHSSHNFVFNSHHIKLQINPDDNSLTAIDSIDIRYIRPTNRIFFFLNDSITVERVSIGHQPLEVVSKKEYDLFRILDNPDVDWEREYANAMLHEVQLPNNLQPDRIEVYYQGSVRNPILPGKRKTRSGENQTTFSDSRVYASEHFWYPLLPNNLSSFRLKALIPCDYRLISSGCLKLQDQWKDSLICVWEEKQKIDQICLYLGKYDVYRETSDGIDISMFFTPHYSAGITSIFDLSKEYLSAYAEVFGPYPYDKYALVEHSVGAGRPSITAVVSRDLREGVSVRELLGREICRNWWGNGVFVDRSQGDWSEGLVPYLSGLVGNNGVSARAKRRQVLADFSLFFSDTADDVPLGCFSARRGTTDNSVGNTKGMMVFHMLRSFVGEDCFYESLQELYREKCGGYASWKDIQSVFQSTCQQDLDWFFDQWLNRCGAPELFFRESSRSIHILQKGEPYRLFVPVHLTTESGMKEAEVEVSGAETVFSTERWRGIRRVEFDPNFDVMRKLDTREIAPCFAQLCLEHDPVCVLPSRSGASLLSAYRDFIRGAIPAEQPEIRFDNEVESTTLRDRTIVLFGDRQENSAFDRWCSGIPDEFKAEGDNVTIYDQDFVDVDCLMLALRHPRNPHLPVYWISTRSPDSLTRAKEEFARYSSFSFLAFGKGQNIVKGNWRTENAMIIDF